MHDLLSGISRKGRGSEVLLRVVIAHSRDERWHSHKYSVLHIAETKGSTLTSTVYARTGRGIIAFVSCATLPLCRVTLERGVESLSRRMKALLLSSCK